MDAFLSHSFSVSKFDWGKFLRTKTLSYTNEEVRTAKWTSWKNIKPALPYGHIGAIPAIELADGGVLDLLLDPKRYLRPNWDQHAVRSSRVMVTDEAWGELVLFYPNPPSLVPRVMSFITGCLGSKRVKRSTALKFTG